MKYVVLYQKKNDVERIEVEHIQARRDSCGDMVLYAFNDADVGFTIIPADDVVLIYDGNKAVYNRMTILWAALKRKVDKIEKGER